MNYELKMINDNNLIIKEVEKMELNFNSNYIKDNFYLILDKIISDYFKRNNLTSMILDRMIITEYFIEN